MVHKVLRFDIRAGGSLGSYQMVIEWMQVRGKSSTRNGKA